MKTVYFIRHAETEAIAQGIMAGSELETELTEQGKQQAKKAGRALADKGIELIVVSPMKRTRQTAAIIAHELNMPDSKVVTNDLVVERGFGKYSGQSFKDYAKALHEGTLDESQLEPTDHFYERIQQAREWLKARPEQTILIVSHGATGRMFRLIEQGRHHSAIREIERFAPTEIDSFTL